MIDISKHSYLKYPLFGSLYFSEGLGFSLQIVIVPIYLVEVGVSLPVATLVAGIASIPWMIKFVWGGIADYFIRFGRKKFIILGGVFAVSSLVLLSFIDPSVALIPFAIILLFTRVGTAFFDVSADAWAIEITREEERGKINAAIIAGTFGGMAVGSSLFGAIAEMFGYRFVFLTDALLVVLIIIFPLLIKEVKNVRIRQKVLTLFLGEFKKKTTQIVTVFAPVFALSSGLLMFVVPLYMKTQLELNIAQIGMITAVFPATKVMGAVIGGFSTDKWGRKITLFIFMSISMAFSALFIFTDTWMVLAVLYSVIGFLHGGSFTAFAAMLMDVTNPKVGATQYSFLTSLANFGELGAGSISGSMATLLGFSRVFLFSAWVIGPALVILNFVDLKKAN